MHQKNKNVINILFDVLLILTPIIIVCFYSLIDKFNYFLNCPILSDEITYWREMYSFDKELFDSGKFYWYNYQPAMLGSFQSHGISPIIAWGLYSLLFNWKYNSIIIANISLITLALLIFAILYRPRIKDILLFESLILVFFPFMQYLTMSMIEIPCYAFLIVFFSICFLFYKTNRNIYYYICIILYILIVFLRPPYAVVLFPAIMIKSNNSFNKRTIIRLLVYVITFFVLYYIYKNTVSVYPYLFTTQLQNETNFINKLLLIKDHFISNTILFFSFSNGDLGEVVIRYSSIILIIIGLLFTLEKKLKNYFPLYCSIMLFGVVLMTIILYDVVGGRDIRMLSPLLFIVLLYYLLSMSSKIKCKNYLILLFFFVSLVSLYLFRPFLMKRGYDVDKQNKYMDFFEKSEIINNKDLTVGIPLNVVDSGNSIYVFSSIPTKCSVVYLSDDIYINNSDIDYLFRYSEKEQLNKEYLLVSSDKDVGYLYKKK